jgi:hypothetical protein
VLTCNIGATIGHTRECHTLLHLAVAAYMLRMLRESVHALAQWALTGAGTCVFRLCGCCLDFALLVREGLCSPGNLTSEWLLPIEELLCD